MSVLCVCADAVCVRERGRMRAALGCDDWAHVRGARASFESWPVPFERMCACERTSESNLFRSMQYASGNVGQKSRRRDREAVMSST